MQNYRKVGMAFVQRPRERIERQVNGRCHQTYNCSMSSLFTSVGVVAYLRFKLCSGALVVNVKL